jgi:2-methylisocitrate lyase-like PEP mutase family enzyme
MVQGGGRTPMLPQDELQKLGYRIAIYPAAGFLAMGAALERVYTDLKAKKAESVPLYDFKKFSALMGFDWVAEFDKRWRDDA